jgi:putative addiction module killer protein
VRFAAHLLHMSLKLKVLKTSEFDDWLSDQPPKTRVIVKARLDMVSLGHFGNHKRFEGLIELRWLNGIRVYTFMWGSALVVAISGGNKNGQDRDIKKAKKIRDEVLEGTRTLLEP